MMRARMVVGAVVGLTLTFATTALGAVEWQPAQTVTLVRGIPDPRVAIDEQGSASLVLSAANDPLSDEPTTLLAVRPPGTEFSDRGAIAGRQDAEIAKNPAGVTAIAAVRDGRLLVTLYPAPGPPAVSGTEIAVPEAGTSVSEPRLGIDEAGRVTVVWTAPAASAGDPSGGVHAVEIAPTGGVGPIQDLAVGAGSCDPDLDVNLRGDAAIVANCAGGQNRLFYRFSGGSFGATDDPFLHDDAPAEVALDGAPGAGRVYMFQTSRTNLGQGTSAYEVAVIGRAPDGVTLFNRLGFVGGEDRDFAFDVEENGRMIAAWASEGAARYVVRQPGQDFGPVRSIASGPVHGLAVVASRFGPSLVSWREHLGTTADPVERVRAAVLDIDGNARVASLGVRGDLGAARDVPVSFAINEAGQAVGAWEQRCSPGGAFAVMAVALDDASTNAQPPCQDTRAPKVIAVGKRATVDGRLLKVRIACDEACRVTASSRVLRRGSRAPLAGGKTRGGERRLAARRGARLSIRMTPAGAARVRRALRARHKVTVRLAVSVRDVYGNGARRRLAVPLVR